MCAPAESEMRVRPPLWHEAVRLGELGRIAVGRAQQNHDGISPGHVHPLEFDRAGASAALRLEWIVQADELMCCAWRDATRVSQARVRPGITQDGE